MGFCMAALQIMLFPIIVRTTLTAVCTVCTTVETVINSWKERFADALISFAVYTVVTTNCDIE